MKTQFDPAGRPDGFIAAEDDSPDRLSTVGDADDTSGSAVSSAGPGGRSPTRPPVGPIVLGSIGARAGAGLLDSNPGPHAKPAMPLRRLLAHMIAPWIAGLAVSGGALAQSVAVPSALEPAEPHERLRFFEGTWTTSDSTPDDGFREICAWLPEGRRHMVCRARWHTASGPREGMSVFSFDPVTGKYIYTGFRAGGALVVQHGEEQGGRWVFGSERGEGQARVRTRVTIEPTAERGFTLVSERSTGDGPWTAGATVVYRRVGR